MKKSSQTNIVDCSVPSLVDSICKKLSLKQEEDKGMCRDILIANSLDVERTVETMKMILQIPSKTAKSDEIPSFSVMLESACEQLMDGDLIEIRQAKSCEENMICDSLFEGLSVKSIETKVSKKKDCLNSTLTTSGELPWWQLGDTRTTQMVARDLVRDLFSTEEVSDKALDAALVRFHFDIETSIEYLCNGGPSVTGARLSFLQALTHNMKDHRTAVARSQAYPPNACESSSSYERSPNILNRQPVYSSTAPHAANDRGEASGPTGEWSEWTTVTKRKGKQTSYEQDTKPANDTKAEIVKNINQSFKFSAPRQDTVRNSSNDSNVSIIEDKAGIELELRQSAQEMVALFNRAHNAAKSRESAPLAHYFAMEGREAKRRFMRVDAMLALLALQKVNPDLNISLEQADTTSKSQSELRFVFYGKKGNIVDGSSVSTSKPKPRELTCDLHGVNVRQAIRFLNAVLTYCREKGGQKWLLTFVVGKGIHSHRCAPQLGPRILSYLSTRGITTAVLSNGMVRFSL